MSGDHPATVEEDTLKKNRSANFACKQLPKTVVGEGGQFVNLKGIRISENDALWTPVYCVHGECNQHPFTWL